MNSKEEEACEIVSMMKQLTDRIEKACDVYRCSSQQLFAMGRKFQTTKPKEQDI